MTNRYAGVTLDWYDDHGETLKRHFPTPNDLPDFIKESSARPIHELQPEDFALVAIDEGTPHCKYACHDPGTTAMSVIYFMEHGDKLPKEAQKVAAANLFMSCREFGLRPPLGLVKMAVEDLIPGGKADDKPASDFPPEQVRMGQKVEMEHTDDPMRAREISRDHLEEFPDYYTRLDKMEQEAKAAKEKTANGDEPEDEGRPPTEEEREKIRSFVKENPNLSDDEFHAFVEKMGLNPHFAEAVVYDMAHELSKTSNVVNITGRRPTPIVKTAMPTSDDDYAVVLSDGTRHYPLDTWDRVKLAERFYQEDGRRMPAELRRQYAVKLAARCHTLGYPLDERIKEAGATSYASKSHIEEAVGMRKIAMANPESHAFLDELFEKRAAMTADTFAEILRRHDVHHGLDRSWDIDLPNPWASTFGIDKTAEVVWESGTDRVTDAALLNLAVNFTPLVEKEFTLEVAEEFKKDPVGIFKSMPDPQKKLLARMANDSASQGGSEATL